MSDDVSVIAAFSEDQVEQLTGLSKDRLRYWDRTGFFSPSYAHENRRVAYSRIYSFRDIVSLRVLSVLRDQYGVSLQHLRDVSERLSHLEDERWTKTALYVLNKKVVFRDSESEHAREVVSGQYVIGIALRTVISDTKQHVERLRRRATDQIGQIERSRYVRHNAWIIAGTRIATASIRRLSEDGYSVNDIIQEYPDLDEEDVRAALIHEEKLSAA